MSLSSIIGKIRKADEDFKLIEDGDRIAVGVSGGKDSLVLLEALYYYRQYISKDFEFVPIHLDLGFGKSDFSLTEQYFSAKEIKIIHYPTSISYILENNLTNKQKISCSLCSKFKKAAMVEAAKIHHCNKIAFAHHQDDAIETLVLNAIYGGRLATFAPKMHLERSDMVFIRPFAYVTEKMIRKTCSENSIPVVPSNCPNDRKTEREKIKSLLKTLYCLYPKARKNFANILFMSRNVSLWVKDKDENDG